MGTAQPGRERSPQERGTGCGGEKSWGAAADTKSRRPRAPGETEASAQEACPGPPPRGDLGLRPGAGVGQREAASPPPAANQEAQATARRLAAPVPALGLSSDLPPTPVGSRQQNVQAPRGPGCAPRWMGRGASRRPRRPPDQGPRVWDGDATSPKRAGGRSLTELRCTDVIGRVCWGAGGGCWDGPPTSLALARGSLQRGSVPQTEKPAPPCPLDRGQGWRRRAPAATASSHHFFVPL